MDASNLTEGLRECYKGKKETDLDHDSEDGSQKSAEEKTVHGENDGGEGTDLTETADAGIGTGEEDSDFEDIVADDGGIDFGKGLGDDSRSRFQVGAGDGRDEDMGMGEDGAGESEGLVKANGADEKGQGFREGDRVDGDAESHSKGESEEQGEDGAGQNSQREPEIGAECARTGDEEEKGDVHEDVAGEDEQNVERVGLLSEPPETLDEGAGSIGDPGGGAHALDGDMGPCDAELDAGGVRKEEGVGGEGSQPVGVGEGKSEGGKGRMVVVVGKAGST